MLKRLKNQKGYTLVELVVCFALLAILMVCVTMMITTSFSIFARLKTTTTAQSVSSLILDRVSMEVAGAQCGASDAYTLVVSNGDSGADYLDFDAGACVALYNRTGSPIYITARENRLLIHYRPVMGTGVILEAVDWDLDDNVYMGFEIVSMTFDILENAETGLDNIIKVSLEIRHTETEMTYTAARYVECYNFTDETDIAKIHFGPILKDVIPTLP